LAIVTKTCPIGGEQFKTRQALSASVFGSYLDLKPWGAIAAPWPMAKCPGNGFVLYKNDFNGQEIARLKPLVASPQYQKMQAVETNYFLAAYLMQAMKEPPQVVAGTLLRATWEVEEDERYPRYAAQALKSYEELISAEQSGVLGPDYVAHQHLAGEFERRLGRFAEAEKRLTPLLDLPIAKRYTVGDYIRQELALIKAKNRLPAKFDGKAQ
jgi:hypothetical protein